MTDYRALLLNSVASDPTRTLTLRSKWVADWNRRIKALKSVVLKAIVEQDVFGLKEQEHFLQVQEDLPVPEPRKFAYRYSQQKVEAFMAWLKEMESRSLLEIIQRPGTLRPEGEPWSNLYVRSAYQRGLEYARTNIASRSAEIAAGMGLKVPLPPSFKSTGAAISALLHQPFHADRLALAYTRVFDELKGVTAAMDQQISRELAKGIMEGLNPRDIGERIGDRIEAIGATRGRLIARTEVINVHAQAALNEYYSAEKTTGEVVLVQWKATHDSRVREKHLDRDMGVYTKEEAYALIGEPNCRCALLPYIPAVQGMPAKATAAARKVCKSAIEDLDEREKKLLEKKVEPEAVVELTPQQQKEAAHSEWQKAWEQYRSSRTADNRSAERAAYYRYVPHMDEAEYLAARRSVVDKMVGMQGKTLAQAKKDSSFTKFYEGVHDGLAQYPLDLVDQMSIKGYKIVFHDKDFTYQKKATHRAFFDGKKTCHLFWVDKTDAVSHEFAHAVDAFFTKQASLGLEWKKLHHFGDMKKVGKELHGEYFSLVKQYKNARGVYSNGEGEFWKDNWVHDYEGRIYSSMSGLREWHAVEWWSMNQQYYYEYEYYKKSFPEMIKKLEEEKARWIARGDARAAEVTEDMIQSRKKMGPEQYALNLADKWKKATERYPKLTEHIKQNFGRDKRIYGQW